MSGVAQGRLRKGTEANRKAPEIARHANGPLLIQKDARPGTIEFPPATESDRRLTTLQEVRVLRVGTVSCPRNRLGRRRSSIPRILLGSRFGKDEENRALPGLRQRLYRQKKGLGYPRSGKLGRRICEVTLKYEAAGYPND